jgi:enamine deaminase RidA (YjgF/YER057c/UK114 family)
MVSMERRVLRAKGAAVPPLPISPAIETDGWVFVSGQQASDYKTGLVADAIVNPELPRHGSRIKSQTRYIFRNISAIMEEAGSSLDNLVRIDQFTTDKKHIDGYLETRNEFITKDRPASTALQMEALTVRDAVIQIDCIGIVPTDGFTKTALYTDKVAKPLAGYSVGIKAGPYVFGAGASPTDFKGAGSYFGVAGTGLAPEARVDPNFWYGSAIKKQTAFDLHKLEAYLEAGGTSLKHCVKAQVYLSHMDDYFGFQEAWNEQFGGNPPATTVVPVKGMGIHESRVEINVIAIVPDRGVDVEVVKTNNAPVPLGHEPQAVRAGKLLFLSGLMACDACGPVREPFPSPAFPHFGSSGKAQMRTILERARAICESSGTSLGNIARAQIFYTDFHDLAPTMEVWADAFPNDPPACTLVQVHDELPVPGCSIIVDLIATVP